MMSPSPILSAFLLSLVLLSSSPSMALRGGEVNDGLRQQQPVALPGNILLNTRRRTQEVDGQPPAPKGDGKVDSSTTKGSPKEESKGVDDAKSKKSPKGEADDKDGEEETSKKSPSKKPKSSKKSKKEAKKACKKAKKESGKSGKSSKSVSSKKGSDGNERKLRSLQQGEEDGTADPLLEENMSYCSQGDLDARQCSNLESMPYDGKHQSLIELELVHDDQKDSETIAQEAEAILDGQETESRFVGCTDMNDGRRRYHHYHRHRSLQEQVLESGHEVIYKTPSQRINVTGVDFKNLVITKDGCQGTSNMPDGSVCDTITSNVDIFYVSDGTDPSDDDRDDMQNLLIETIMNQARSGAFESIGTIENVQLEGNNRGGLFGSSSNGDSDSGLGFIGFIVGGLVVVALVLTCVYCFCFKQPESSSVRKTEKIEETSDEEEHTSDEDEARNAQNIPIAQVVAVEETEPTTKKKAAATTSEIPKEKVDDQAAGGWFEWVSNADENNEKSKKKKDDKATTDKKTDGEWTSWW